MSVRLVFSQMDDMSEIARARVSTPVGRAEYSSLRGTAPRVAANPNVCTVRMKKKEKCDLSKV